MNPGQHRPPRTWDGTRWFFIVLSLVFAGVCAWLVFHENILRHPAALLLSIPGMMAFGALGIALFASDRALQQIATFLQGL